MTLMKNEGIECRYADGMAELIDHNLSGDLYNKKLEIDIHQKINIKDKLQQYLIENFGQTIRFGGDSTHIKI